MQEIKAFDTVQGYKKSFKTISAWLLLKLLVFSGRDISTVWSKYLAILDALAVLNAWMTSSKPGVALKESNMKEAVKKINICFISYCLGEQVYLV